MEAQGEIDDKYVLANTLGGGPKGLGDPDDMSLRKAEREILIPQKMKEKAKKGQCLGVVEDFGKCAKEKGLLMPFQCRQAARALQECLAAAYKDPKFIDECTQEYLHERSEYRRTGVRTRTRRKDVIA